MLLQTNSYIVPKDKRSDHARLMRRFRQTLLRLGCDHFEVYEQVGSNWSNAEATGRYVQILRFVDRKHQLAVQAAERTDPTAQGVIAEFCDLINFPYQQQQGLFAVGFYTSVLPMALSHSGGEFAGSAEGEVVEGEAQTEQEVGRWQADNGEAAIGEAGHVESANGEAAGGHEFVDEGNGELVEDTGLEIDDESEHRPNRGAEHLDA